MARSTTDNRLSTKIDTLDNKIDGKLGELIKQLTELGKSITELNSRLGSLSTTSSDHESRLRVLERELTISTTKMAFLTSVGGIIGSAATAVFVKLFVH